MEIYLKKEKEKERECTRHRQKEKRKGGRGYSLIFSFRGFVNGTSLHEDICETLKALAKF